MLKEQTVAPDFTLVDENNVSHSLSDYIGEHVLLYFYPKDDTPGCTKEACAIRDVYDEFEKKGIKVLGVSADSPESHKKFKAKYELPFTLLSDKKKEVIKLYGASSRISYLIDPMGFIAKTYPKVDPTTHAETILKDFSRIS